ncbi:MAG TPA: hypothetical protein VJP45_12270 [Candidatus Limnocylindria bacterium]|nr:hypothetical protein [Candidatus Limnocylindria bacterium]
MPLSTKQQLRRALPPAVLVVVGTMLAFIDAGALSWLGGGVAAGVASAAAYLYVRREKERRAAHDAHAAEMRVSSEEADRRVELVIRQFEWAVNDVAKLRRDLVQAEATVQALTERGRQREHQLEQLVRQISQLRERLAEVAMAASTAEPATPETARSSAEAIRFSFGLHLDGPRARLELQTMATSDSPTRLRVMDRDGQIVAVSGMAVVSVDGMLEFQLEPPLDLIADLDEGRDINYAIEALTDDVWKPVRLRDSGRRTHNAVDIHGQISRVADIRDATHLVNTAHDRRSALN